MRIDEDTTAHDLIIDQWQHVGNKTRVIRSHRQPRSTHRGPIALVLAAVAVAAGITTTAAVTTPEPAAHVVAGTFVPPSDDAILQRMIDDAYPPASRTDRPATPKVKTPKPAPKPRWVSPTTPATTTSCYGMRWGHMHEGIDFNGETGDKVRSVGVGTVVQAGWRYSGLGYSVVIRHPGGWMTLYGHLSKVAARPGQAVSAGDLVGLVGSTGHSTGSHLHFGVAKASTPDQIFNSFVNPSPWLKARGVSAGRC